jgi:hypothetical protein
VLATLIGIPLRLFYTEYGWHGWRLPRLPGMAVPEAIGGGSLMFMRLFGRFAVVFAGLMWFALVRSKSVSLMWKFSATVGLVLSVMGTGVYYFWRINLVAVKSEM